MEIVKLGIEIQRIYLIKLKVVKFQEVFLFSSHLQKNARNQYLSTFPNILKSWQSVILLILEKMQSLRLSHL